MFKFRFADDKLSPFSGRLVALLPDLAASFAGFHPSKIDQEDSSNEYERV